MLTLNSALDRTLRLYGERNAVVDDEGSFTWLQFADRAARAAGLLRRLGVEPGERFGILSRNSFRQFELMHGAWWLGAVPVPINTRLAPHEVRFILDDADCRLIAIEDALWQWSREQALAPWTDRLLCLAGLPGDTAAAHYETLLAETPPEAMHDAAEDEDALLLYTGGTTGRSKGVRLSHRNIVANGLQMVVQFNARSEDNYMHVAPMFHAADLLATAFTLVGAAHTFLPQFSGLAVLQAIERHQVSVCMMAPTMIIMTLQEETLQDFDLRSLRRLFYGSSPMAAEWVRRTIEAFPGTAIQQGYGLTETSPILTTLEPEEHTRAVETGEYGILKAAGRAVIGVDLKILDNDGAEVPVGEVGEVVVRGPNISKGYLNRPEENAKAFREGWFFTGDLGRLDAQGYMFLVDRKKDMVITGGENVYTTEVEAALYQHPNVFEAAVIGVPDERYGEALFGVVVPRPGTELSAEELIEHCRGRIGGYKIPRKMVFVETLPKSAMGKILKTELRKMYSGQT